ncbi:hypothetical protein EVAR_55279_1 [Eumeta japonica]|uniref:Uncharacterized protein n=1 Tax=Eumeta variegata TaxID=151549 RepID=A0A4C1ZG02_EUMVA|nr:hypothetical protein EVAR_55279_1 [Eumeta japonica]
MRVFMDHGDYLLSDRIESWAQPVAQQLRADITIASNETRRRVRTDINVRCGGASWGGRESDVTSERPINGKRRRRCEIEIRRLHLPGARAPASAGAFFGSRV